MKSIYQIFEGNEHLMDLGPVEELIDYCQELEGQVMENVIDKQYDKELILLGMVRDIYDSCDGIEEQEMLHQRYPNVREELEARPLGTVIERFRESVDTDQPELLAEELKRVLDARNQLVHHFFQLPGVELMTLDGVRAAICYLDEQFHSTQSLYEMVRSQSAAVLLGIISSPGYESSDLAHHRPALLKAIGPDAEIIKAGDPSKTVWETTRVVQLLKLAEHETVPFEGMTLLSRGGQFIRKSAPELSPKIYGLKRL